MTAREHVNGVGDAWEENDSLVWGAQQRGVLARSFRLLEAESNLVRLKELAEAGINTNPKDAQGYTRLHRTIESDLTTCAINIIKIGIDIDVKDSTGSTPLHTAIENGNDKVFKALLEAGVNINAQTKIGYTPLHLATQFRNHDIMKSLLRAGADIDGHLYLSPDQTLRIMVQPVFPGSKLAAIIRLLLFQDGVKTQYTIFRTKEASPDYLLECMEASRQELYSAPTKIVNNSPLGGGTNRQHATSLSCKFNLSEMKPTYPIYLTTIILCLLDKNSEPNLHTFKPDTHGGKDICLSRVNLSLSKYFRNFHLICVVLMLLILAGIEQNTGPKMSKQTTLETSLDRDKDIKDLINALTKRLDSWGERLESRLSAIDDRVENINQRLQQLEESSAVTKVALSQNSKQIKDLEDQLEYLDAKSRERNLIFYGIEQDNNEDCRERIRKVIEENMQTKEKINITRCHRLSRKPGAPILIEVPEQNDRSTLFKAAFNLRGTKISLSKDYSMKTREQRRVLNVKRKELVERGTLAKLRDNKLIINDIAYKKGFEDNTTLSKNFQLNKAWEGPLKGGPVDGFFLECMGASGVARELTKSQECRGPTSTSPLLASSSMKEKMAAPILPASLVVPTILLRDSPSSDLATH
ncbi:hypothetical protein LAZ67_6000446 [Cordylochernes scorpioides]|uniref:Uncharacterized protein n=1 Tax=Cordylochernes scorpioides TaxID=51811 RepID=A0ABY6KIL5_9ARAC|nr:hypothetical protein LAZ67_6000446 [Cordylochernes scorpioides]